MESINYIISENKKSTELPEKLEFGHLFTDHLFEMDYSPEKGWHNPTIRPFGNLELSPATMVFHYGQTVFDGLKAYKTVSGKTALFRPEKHIARLNNSSIKLCIPQVDPDFLLKALLELIKVEERWVPNKKGYSLYIRPFIFGSDPVIGVHPSKTYKLYIILSPVAAYYAEGFKPVSILATDEYVRAVRKGLGDCKTAANYAASLYGAEMAAKKGYTQVLWMDGVEQKYIEEVGTMNMFVNFADEVATPTLTGSILPGITRMTVLELLKSWGYNVNERLISIQEIVDGYKNGNVKGMFGTGTAAVISPVGKLTYKNTEMVFNDGKAGELDLKLFDEISSIQYGIKPDVHNWLTYLQ